MRVRRYLRICRCALAPSLRNSFRARSSNSIAQIKSLLQLTQSPVFAGFFQSFYGKISVFQVIDVLPNSLARVKAIAATSALRQLIQTCFQIGGDANGQHDGASDMVIYMYDVLSCMYMITIMNRRVPATKRVFRGIGLQWSSPTSWSTAGARDGQ